MLNGRRKSKEDYLGTLKNHIKFKFQCPLKFYWNRAQLTCLHIAYGSSCSSMELSGRDRVHGPWSLKSLWSGPLQKVCWALHQAMACTGVLPYLSRDTVMRGGVWLGLRVRDRYEELQKHLPPWLVHLSLRLFLKHTQHLGIAQSFIVK